MDSEVPSSFANQGWQTLLRHASVSLPQPQLRLSCCGVEAGLLGGHAASAEDVCVACRCSRCLPQHQPPRSVPAASANGSLSSSGGSACAEDSHGERQRLHRGPDSSKGPPPAPSYIFFLQEWYMHAMQTAAGAEHDGAARKALAAARLATAAENGDAAAAARLDRLVKSEVMVVGEPEPSGGRPQEALCDYLRVFHQRYHRNNKISQLLGRRVQVMWYNEEREVNGKVVFGTWYPGKVISVHPEEGYMKLAYDDGTEGDATRVSLALNFVHFGDSPPAKGRRAQLPLPLTTQNLSLRAAGYTAAAAAAPNGGLAKGSTASASRPSTPSLRSSTVGERAVAEPPLPAAVEPAAAAGAQGAGKSGCPSTPSSRSPCASAVQQQLGQQLKGADKEVKEDRMQQPQAGPGGGGAGGACGQPHGRLEGEDPALRKAGQAVADGATPVAALVTAAGTADDSSSPQQPEGKHTPSGEAPPSGQPVSCGAASGHAPGVLGRQAGEADKAGPISNAAGHAAPGIEPDAVSSGQRTGSEGSPCGPKRSSEGGQQLPAKRACLPLVGEHDAGGPQQDPDSQQGATEAHGDMDPDPVGARASRAASPERPGAPSLGTAVGHPGASEQLRPGHRDQGPQVPSLAVRDAQSVQGNTVAEAAKDGAEGGGAGELAETAAGPGSGGEADITPLAPMNFERPASAAILGPEPTAEASCPAGSHAGVEVPWVQAAGVVPAAVEAAGNGSVASHLDDAAPGAQQDGDIASAPSNASPALGPRSPEGGSGDTAELLQQRPLTDAAKGHDGVAHVAPRDSDQAPAGQLGTMQKTGGQGDGDGGHGAPCASVEAEAGGSGDRQGSGAPQAEAAAGATSGGPADGARGGDADRCSGGRVVSNGGGGGGDDGEEGRGGRGPLGGGCNGAAANGETDERRSPKRRRVECAGDEECTRGRSNPPGDVPEHCGSGYSAAAGEDGTGMEGQEGPGWGAMREAGIRVEPRTCDGAASMRAAVTPPHSSPLGADAPLHIGEAPAGRQAPLADHGLGCAAMDTPAAAAAGAAAASSPAACPATPPASAAAVSPQHVAAALEAAVHNGAAAVGLQPVEPTCPRSHRSHPPPPVLTAERGAGPNAPATATGPATVQHVLLPVDAATAAAGSAAAMQSVPAHAPTSAPLSMAPGPQRGAVPAGAFVMHDGRFYHASANAAIATRPPPQAAPTAQLPQQAYGPAGAPSGHVPASANAMAPGPLPQQLHAAPSMAPGPLAAAAAAAPMATGLPNQGRPYPPGPAGPASTAFRQELTARATQAAAVQQASTTFLQGAARSRPQPAGAGAHAGLVAGAAGLDGAGGTARVAATAGPLAAGIIGGSPAHAPLSASMHMTMLAARAAAGGQPHAGVAAGQLPQHQQLVQHTPLTAASQPPASHPASASTYPAGAPPNYPTYPAKAPLQPATGPAQQQSAIPAAQTRQPLHRPISPPLPAPITQTTQAQSHTSAPGSAALAAAAHAPGFPQPGRGRAPPVSAEPLSPERALPSVVATTRESVPLGMQEHGDYSQFYQVSRRLGYAQQAAQVLRCVRDKLTANASRVHMGELIHQGCIEMGCEPLYARVLALSSIQQAYIELHGKELESKEVSEFLLWMVRQLLVNAAKEAADLARVRQQGPPAVQQTLEPGVTVEELWMVLSGCATRCDKVKRQAAESKSRNDLAAVDSLEQSMGTFEELLRSSAKQLHRHAERQPQPQAQPHLNINTRLELTLSRVKRNLANAAAAAAAIAGQEQRHPTQHHHQHQPAPMTFQGSAPLSMAPFVHQPQQLQPPAQTQQPQQQLDPHRPPLSMASSAPPGQPLSAQQQQHYQQQQRQPLASRYSPPAAGQPLFAARSTSTAHHQQPVAPSAQRPSAPYNLPMPPRTHAQSQAQAQPQAHIVQSAAPAAQHYAHALAPSAAAAVPARPATEHEPRPFSDPAAWQALQAQGSGAIPPPAAAAAVGAAPPFAARGPSADRAVPPMVAQAGQRADATNSNRDGRDSDSDSEMVEVGNGALGRPGRRAPDPLRGMRWCLDADQLTHLLRRAGSRRPARADGGSPGDLGATQTDAEGGWPSRPSSSSLGSGGAGVVHGAPAAAGAPNGSLRLRTSGDGREAAGSGSEGGRPGVVMTRGNTAGRASQEPAQQHPHVTSASDVVGSEVITVPWNATLRKRADAVAQARAAVVVTAVQAAIGGAAAGAAAGGAPSGDAGRGVAVPDPVELPSPELVQQLTEEWLDRSVLALLQQHIVGMGDGQASGAEQTAPHAKAASDSTQQQPQQDKEARRQWLERATQAWRQLPFDNRRSLYMMVCRIYWAREAGPAAGAEGPGGAVGGPGATGGEGGVAGSRLGSWYILEHLARFLDVAHGVLPSAAPAAAPTTDTDPAARVMAAADGRDGVACDGGEGGQSLMLQRMLVEARVEDKAGPGADGRA